MGTENPDIDITGVTLKLFTVTETTYVLKENQTTLRLKEQI